MNAQWVVPPTQPAPASWWQRNRRWAIPVLIADAVVMTALVALAVYLVVLAAFRNSGAYNGALARAQSDPAVVRALGEPIQPGWWVNGSIRVSGSSGTARFETSLRGPSGRGTLRASAVKRGGRWRYSLLEVAVAGARDRIDLREGGDGAGGPPPAAE